MSSELIKICELLMASAAFTPDNLFLLHCSANFVDLNSNRFAIKLARRLDIGPFLPELSLAAAMSSDSSSDSN